MAVSIRYHSMILNGRHRVVQNKHRLSGRTDSQMADLVPNLQSLIDSERFLAAVNIDAIDGMLDARDTDEFDAE